MPAQTTPALPPGSLVKGFWRWFFALLRRAPNLPPTRPPPAPVLPDLPSPLPPTDYFEAFWLSLPSDVPDSMPLMPARRSRRPPMPPVSPAVRSALFKLRLEEIWPVPDARALLGPLRPLERATEIRIIMTGVGPGVILGAQGRRRTRVDRRLRTHVPPGPMTDLLYLRLAAEAHGWTITTMPSRLHGSRVGVLDRFAVAERNDKTVRILARYTDGGYAKSTVRKTFQFVRSSLMFHRTVLIVVTPDVSRLAPLIGQDDLLEIIVYVPGR